MLPTILAKHLQTSLQDYINSMYPMVNSGFRDSLLNLFKTKNAVFHEPYVSVGLPFRMAVDFPRDFFEFLELKYAPYVHQQKAYERLALDGGRSTLIATGTGSGKTECFLLPILEYCGRHFGEKGIKALIIYPMNALAADQAKRIASLIYNNPKLKDRVSAGMYVGGQEASPSAGMTETRIITSREAMLSSPPDILLTNYKMLDYLLVRPRDAALWAENKPETLKFVVVDELHSFDGAQGTDLACLLRRLKSRLESPAGHICCVGTSATMGGPERGEKILEFASEVFSERFDDGGLIAEERITAAEFFADSPASDYSFPDAGALREFRESDLDSLDQNSYLESAARIWFGDEFSSDDITSMETRLKIGDRLKEHYFVQSLVSFLESGIAQNEGVRQSFAGGFSQLSDADGADDALDSLLALVAHARTRGEGGARPFLNLRVHLWLRELRRLLGKVTGSVVTYSPDIDLVADKTRNFLPVVNCRDCGETGWATIVNETHHVRLSDLNAFYGYFFNNNERIRLIYPEPLEQTKESAPPKLELAYLCPNCMLLDHAVREPAVCPACEGERFLVRVTSEIELTPAHSRSAFKCPHCHSTSGLTIMGLRSATAISLIISQLLASKFNFDKKALAFSDNVQDAAHLAGFLNFRTWALTFRRAVQVFADKMGEPLRLADFSDLFVNYWHKEMKNDEFIGYFIHPNMTWMSAYDSIVRKRFNYSPAHKILMEKVEKRLRHEIMLEYGMGSRAGWTLEKSGCSVLAYDPEKLRSVVSVVMERAMNEVGLTADYSPAIYGSAVVGFLNILKINGAFNDRVYESYTKNNFSSFLLSNSHIDWLPGHQGSETDPRFIFQKVFDLQKQLPSVDHLGISGVYAKWIFKCFYGHSKLTHNSDAIAKIVLEELSKFGILVMMPSPEAYNLWALDKNEVWVTTRTAQVVCPECGHRVTVGRDNLEFWTGSVCQRPRCLGIMREDQSGNIGYFGKMYKHGDLLRTSAKEHTGLLKRNEREELETSFKKSRKEQKPWDTNVLACTPTLEMGIDIGDLSAIVLANVPPGQSQYVQRTGRAGRTDGNSLCATVAGNKSHDLFFYADPAEMMAGEVEPPKIFLKATAVLERQFIAFSMDNWIKDGVSEHVIPLNIGLCLKSYNNNSVGKFPLCFLDYVQANLDNLLVRFLKLFPELAEPERKALVSFARVDDLGEPPLRLKFRDALKGVEKQKKGLEDSLQGLGAQLKILKDKPWDKSFKREIDQLEMERNSLGAIKRHLLSRNVFNFLSDEGLLPNYAFPESGVALRAYLHRYEIKRFPRGSKHRPRPDAASTDSGSQADFAFQVDVPSSYSSRSEARSSGRGGIQEKKPKKEEMKKTTLVFDYSRSAGSALIEFAPLNTFYAEGHKLFISQLDVNTSKISKWRLCPNCAHAQLEETSTSTVVCPKCGSLAWSDAGQVCSMLKTELVFSNMDYSESFIEDDSDDRRVTYYCTKILVDPDVGRQSDPGGGTVAYRMDNDEFSFGFEFVDKATIREINFGKSDTSADRFSVAGEERARSGFRICRNCGRVQTDRQRPVHELSCKHRIEHDNSDFYEDKLYLFREFDTEILRVLVPATTMDNTYVRESSFIAAFRLGMKEYFGNVDHIRATILDMPIKDTSYRKKYLVLYDTVPGGTGYLKQLTQKSHSLTEILEKALVVLENCECRDDTKKDGCYHCLFSYHLSSDMGHISRNSSVQLLKQILSGRERMTKISSLDDVPVDTLFESELEAQFIAALNHLAGKPGKPAVEKDLVRGRECYSLVLGENSVWEIEPQVELGPADGTSVPTRADFVIRPVGRTGGGGALPVAVYMDGFEYHWKSVADDLRKREALRQSGKFRVWTLTWKDVSAVFHMSTGHATETMSLVGNPNAANMYNNLVKNQADRDFFKDKNPLELLLGYLGRDDAEQVFQLHATGRAVSLLDPQIMNDQEKFLSFKSRADDVAESLGLAPQDFEFKNTFFGVFAPQSFANYFSVLTGVRFQEFQRDGYRANITVFACLDDLLESRSEEYEREWNGFWHFYNLMQFYRGFAAVANSMTSLGVLPAAPVPPVSSPPSDLAPVSGWGASVLELVLPGEALNFAMKCSESGVPAPDSVGYELSDRSGAVIGEAELVWENLKIAFLHGGQLQYREKFASLGFRVLTPVDDPAPTFFVETR
jgi:DEAD/DEAH box helicase domain-containing protein